MMERRSALALNPVKAIAFPLLLGCAIAAPLLGNQFVTGTIVNATLFIATAMFGVSYGMMIAIIPSAFALAVGLLPSVLAPMIPFIIFGNAVLIVIFGGWKKEGWYWPRMIAAGVVKFALIYSASLLVTKWIVNEAMAANVAVMMSWPQLVTAICGGILAFGILKLRKRSF
mgnify:CR=1 FL=1